MNSDYPFFDDGSRQKQQEAWEWNSEQRQRKREYLREHEN